MKNKNKFRILSVLLSCCLLVCALPVSAAAADNTNYPYVFVHGMMGWGEYDGVNSLSPYWGGSNGDMLAALEEQGYTCYAASVGKVSSNWDRACELYAQLTGTVVDYGEAHSKAHGHARYGRSYEGRALLDTFGKTDENGDLIKINLFGHSLGGPTVRLFTWLLENGSAEECAVSGEDVSSFFTGGKGEYVHSVTTWSAPHNGTPAANILYDQLPTAYLLAFMGNLLGCSSVSGFWDYQLEQFGLTSVPEQGITAKLNLAGIVRMAKSNDNCGYDLTIRGAKALNEMIDTVDGVYYFSFTGEKVDLQPDGTYKAQKDMFILFPLLSNKIGKLDGEVYDGVSLGANWRENDGLVPVISGQAPFDEASVFYSDAKDETLETGVWHIMPLIENFSHVSYMGMDTDNFQYLYEEQMARINAL